MTLAEVAERLRTENRKARLVHDIALAGGREEAIKAFEADPDFHLRGKLEEIGWGWERYENFRAGANWPVEAAVFATQIWKLLGVRVTCRKCQKRRRFCVCGGDFAGPTESDYELLTTSERLVAAGYP